MQPPSRPLRVVAVLPEPTPYRTPLLDRLARRPELELTAVYSAGAIAGNRWDHSPGHPHLVLHGVRVPGAARILRHDYPLTPGVFSALGRLRPDVVVVTGWSTFASQVAILWSLARQVPFVLQVESHELGRRPVWRRALKRAVVTPAVRRAAGALVTGTLARDAVLARGADPAHVRVFANTVDTHAFAREAELARAGLPALRARLGITAGETAVLCVARLSPEKGLDVLVRAAAAAGSEIHVLVAGTGSENDVLERLARDLGVRLTLLGGVPWERIAETYAAVDVFALLSRHEPWGVVVNEAAACGLPLVLSDRVGAAPDLLEPGRNGYLVPVDDANGAAAALTELGNNPPLRRAMGQRSHEIAAAWAYEPSVDSFLAAVEQAARAGSGQDGARPRKRRFLRPGGRAGRR